MKELSTDSQKKSILDWLSEGNTITALQALNMFGCLRLASRINDLKNDGFPIAKEMIEVNGKRVAQYWLQRTRLSMTRGEEIEKASDKYIEDYLKSSNEYPLCDNRKRMSLIQVDLYKMQDAFENGMKEADRTMLDRACEWLAERISPEEIYEYETDETPTTYLTVNLHDNMLDFITAFRRAMEGGAE